MPAENDRRAAKSLAFDQLREMDRIHQGFPFGSDISQRILVRLGSMVFVTNTAKGGFSGRPADQHIYSQLTDASAAYAELGRMAHIGWIENHEVVRLRLSQLLSPSKARKYRMSDEEMRVWSYSVVSFAKTFAQKLKPKRMVREEYQRRAQICIDVIHTLITNLRDNTVEALFREDSSFLVSLCQKTILLPRSFLCPGTLQIEGDPIDAGASANVFRGSVDEIEVAVKSFRLYSRTLIRAKKRFIREALILQIVRHPNVLRFMSILNEDRRICIITPWYPHGHIMKYIDAVPDVCLKELMEQVADGLHFLLQYKIVHGDLKGGNILIDNGGKAVIADLGLSFIQEEQENETPSHAVEDPFVLAILRAQCSEALRSGKLSVSAASISTLAATVLSAASSTGGGTFRWMAPERLAPSAYDLPTARATMRSDVYSFGMLILEVYTRAPPWGSRAEMSIAFSVISALRPPRPIDIEEGMWVIAQECWAHQPEQRPSILDVYNRLACMP
ncbi:kinase-like domain-containing protein [Mycena maculata]|uniref:Kinase-like domain-containing protein n=1 Tax=Mycena maculata TaxID=230809 RepID=A0AAD7K3R4_9AGAR|nr:kinase-like domain-containing protein [Mycena maculata]